MRPACKAEQVEEAKDERLTLDKVTSRSLID